MGGQGSCKINLKSENWKGVPLQGFEKRRKFGDTYMSFMKGSKVSCVQTLYASD